MPLYSIMRGDSAPTKLSPLSEYTWAGQPLRETNIEKQARKASVMSSDTSSMWMAFVVKQMKSAA